MLPLKSENPWENPRANADRAFPIHLMVIIVQMAMLHKNKKHER